MTLDTSSAASGLGAGGAVGGGTAGSVMPDPGRIRITVSVADGAIGRVDIASTRLMAAAAMFAGRELAVVEAAVVALHGLCGRSHGAAMRFGAAAALGEPIDADETALWVGRLAGERLAEHLRVMFADRRDDTGLAALREAVALGRKAARDGRIEAEDGDRLHKACDRLIGASEAGGDSAEAGAPVDRLTATDDAAVIAALGTDLAFAARPHLGGRAPETGPAARAGVSAADRDAARAARVAEVREAIDILASGASDLAAATVQDWIRAERLGDATGFAAVETPRGRLHYRLAVGEGRRLGEARVLAPTEWNFAAGGPLVRSLVGRRTDAIAAEAAGDLAAAIEARIAAFDPCVAFALTIRDGRHA